MHMMSSNRGFITVLRSGVTEMQINFYLEEIHLLFFAKWHITKALYTTYWLV